MRKDKKQVIGEEVSDEAIKLFLEPEPADETPASLHKLIKAYRGLRVDDFERFLGFFVEAGFDLNAKDAKGQDFVALIADQRLAEPYLELIKAARGLSKSFGGASAGTSNTVEQAAATIVFLAACIL